MSKFVLTSKKKNRICLESESNLIEETHENWNHLSVYVIKKDNRVLFEFLAESRNECRAFLFGQGVLFITENIIGYSDGTLDLRLKRENILNVCVEQNVAYILENTKILRFRSDMLKRKRKGYFKMPTESFRDIDNLFGQFTISEFKESFKFLENGHISYIATKFKVAILKSASTFDHPKILKLQQVFQLNEEIRNLKPNFIEGTYNDYLIEKEDITSSMHSSFSARFKPTIKTIQALENSEDLTEAVDIFWFQEIKGDLEPKLISD